MNALSHTPPATQTFHINMKVVVLSYIFLALPLFDMLNGFLIAREYLDVGTLASPSQIGRAIGIFLLLACTGRQKYSPYIILMLFGLFVLETLLFFRHNNIIGAVLGYANIVRFLYMYLVFVAFVSYIRIDLRIVIRFLKYNVIFICFSIIFASFAGLGNSTYGWGAGTKGFFASGNGLGIYIGVATLILAAMKRYRICTDVHISIFALSAYTLVLLGTKTAFLLFLFTTVAGFWSGRFRILIVPAVIFGSVRFFHEISYKLTDSFDIIIIRYRSSPSLIDYILSGRNVYAENAWAEFISQDPGFLRWVFGGGAFLSFQNPLWVKSFDTLETDFFDVLFMYGLVGLICYAFCFFFSVRSFLGSPWMLLPIILLWGHSAFAGHVLFNGFGVTLIVLILAIGTRFKEYKDIGDLKQSRSIGSRKWRRR